MVRSIVIYRKRDNGFFYFFSANPSRNASPLAVRKYFCPEWRGLSGYNNETKPKSIAGFRYKLKKLSLPFSCIFAIIAFADNCSPAMARTKRWISGLAITLSCPTCPALVLCLSCACPVHIGLLAPFCRRIDMKVTVAKHPTIS